MRHAHIAAGQIATLAHFHLKAFRSPGAVAENGIRRRYRVSVLIASSRDAVDGVADAISVPVLAALLPES